jgi:MFS family permease
LVKRLPWQQPRETIEQQNAWRLYNEVFWWGVMTGVAGTFLGVYAVRLGASAQLMGLLTALPALVTSLGSIPAARLVERQRQRVPIILLAAALQRGGYLLVALMPFATLRASVVSLRNFLLTLVSTATSLTAGWVLDLIRFPYNYQILFAVAAAASLLSLPHLHRLQATETAPPHHPPAHGRFLVRLRATLQSSSQQGSFWRFAAGTFAFYWGLYLPIPLYNLYRVRELGASDGWIGLLSVAFNLSSLLPFVFWGRQVGRRGNRWVMLVSAAGLSLYPTFTGLSPRIEPLLLASLWGGLFAPGFNLAVLNALLENTPSDHRPSYVGIHSTLVSVAAFLAPLLGSALSETWGVRTILVASGGGRLLGVFALLVLLPRPPSTT